MALHWLSPRTLRGVDSQYAGLICVGDHRRLTDRASPAVFSCACLGALAAQLLGGPTA